MEHDKEEREQEERIDKLRGALSIANKWAKRYLDTLDSGHEREDCTADVEMCIRA